MAASPAKPSPIASYEVTELGRHVPEAVGRAREGRAPVLITDQDEPLAAIVGIEELDRLYELEERMAVRTIARELEATEARGEAVWYTPKQIRELQQELLGEAGERGRRARAAAERASST